MRFALLMILPLGRARKLWKRMKRHVMTSAGQQPRFETAGHCHSVSFTFSPAVLALRAAFLARLGLTNRSFVTLHVRRTDAASLCNTSVDDVARYVACSQRTSAAAQAAPLVLFTDELSPHYLYGLLTRLATEANGGRGPVYHGDALLHRLAAGGGDGGDNGGDNYFIYAATSAIKESAAGWLTRRHEMRHGNCNRCDNPFELRRRRVRDDNPLPP